MLADFFFSLTTTIMDTQYYNGNKLPKFILSIIIYTPLIIVTAILIWIKRKKPFVAGGFLYLVLGTIAWLYKIINVIYLIISGNLETDYGKQYSDFLYLICFLINLITIFFRLFSCYLMKKLFSDILKLEEYRHEKAHAEFLQSLATNIDVTKLCEDEEITEEQLYARQNNPFVGGREKNENEEEEICFQTTL